MTTNAATARPPWLKAPLELTGLIEYAHSRLRPPKVDAWPRGNDLPVLLLPGFGQDERSLEPMRRCLRSQGFAVHGWGLGRNLGMKAGMTAQLLSTLHELRAQHEQAPALVGWSLGGTIARELARKEPEATAHVVTLGSPIAGPHATTLQPLFRLLNPGQPVAGYNPARHAPPPVPCTAVYTRSDGVVAWPTACELPAPNTENIEVRGAHLALGYNPAVWFVICHRLSPETRNQVFAWPDGRQVPPARYSAP